MEGNVIIPFFNDEFNVRTAGTWDQPLFCLTDICKSVNIRADHVSGRIIDAPYLIGVIDSMGRKQQVKFVTESDMYRIVMRCDKPEALRFQNWVTKEVLPQIRKTGGYIPVKEEDDDLTIMCKAYQISQRTIEEKDKLIAQRDNTIVHLEDKIKKDKPKVELANKLWHSENSYTIEKMAKALNISTQSLYKKLRDIGHFGHGKDSGRYNLPYNKFVSKGYYELKYDDAYRGNKLKLIAYVTAKKGFMYLINKFGTQEIKSKYEDPLF